MAIRLLIADDHELVRAGLQATFALTRIEIVGEAKTCDEAIQLALEVAADVMLLDIRMPGGDGFEVLRRVRATTALPVVMYSMYDRERYFHQARELGASSYLTKRASSKCLVATVEAASRGETNWRDACCGSSPEEGQPC